MWGLADEREPNGTGGSSSSSIGIGPGSSSTACDGDRLLVILKEEPKSTSIEVLERIVHTSDGCALAEHFASVSYDERCRCMWYLLKRKELRGRETKGIRLPRGLAWPASLDNTRKNKGRSMVTERRREVYVLGWTVTVVALNDDVGTVADSFSGNKKSVTMGLVDVAGRTYAVRVCGSFVDMKWVIECNGTPEEQALVFDNDEGGDGGDTGASRMSDADSSTMLGIASSIQSRFVEDYYSDAEDGDARSGGGDMDAGPRATMYVSAPIKQRLNPRLVETHAGRLVVLLGPCLPGTEPKLCENFKDGFRFKWKTHIQEDVERSSSGNLQHGREASLPLPLQQTPLHSGVSAGAGARATAGVPYLEEAVLAASPPHVRGGGVRQDGLLVLPSTDARHLRAVVAAASAQSAGATPRATQGTTGLYAEDRPHQEGSQLQHVSTDRWEDESPARRTPRSVPRGASESLHSQLTMESQGASIEYDYDQEPGALAEGDEDEIEDEDILTQPGPAPGELPIASGSVRSASRRGIPTVTAAGTVIDAVVASSAGRAGAQARIRARRASFHHGGV